jgi:flagellar motor switch protein FliG
MTAQALLPIFENEATEIAAVVMSRLEVPHAAEVLSLLPGDRARRITYAMSQTGAVTPDTVDRIGLSLAAQLDAQPPRAFEDGPEKRVGAILNFSSSETRDSLLSALEGEDQDFADRVRKTIFTFKDIPARISPLDVAKFTRAVDQSQLVMALAHAQSTEDGDVTEFILTNLSSRMADSLRDEISEAGTVKPKAGEEAMTAVILAIRSLEDTGELEMITDDEE